MEGTLSTPLQCSHVTMDTDYPALTQLLARIHWTGVHKFQYA